MMDSVINRFCYLLWVSVADGIRLRPCLGMTHEIPEPAGLGAPRRRAGPRNDAYRLSLSAVLCIARSSVYTSCRTLSRSDTIA